MSDKGMTAARRAWLRERAKALHEVRTLECLDEIDRLLANQCACNKPEVVS